MNMPLALLNRRRRGAVAFSPTALFAASEPGVWYDPSDVANLDWRRNLLTWTEQFDNAAWRKNQVSVSANTGATTDPLGGNTADVLSETATTNFHFLDLATALSFAATQYTFTAYLKQGSSRYGGIHINDGTARGCSIDLQTGTLGTPYGSATASREVLANGWYKLTVTATTSATASGQVAIYISNANSLASYAGNIANNIYVWGAQLELGSTATEYQRITDVNTEVIQRFPSATLYQDTAGTTPVTTPGQTVALALDKSKGLVLGSELVTNGDFSSGTGWTVTPEVTISGGVATFTASASSSALFRSASVVVGRTYEITVVVTSVSSGTIRPRLFGGAATPLIISAAGTYTFKDVLTTSNSNVGFVTTGPFTGVVDNISVKELPGNHATQATAGSRPIYGIVPVGGRRNLLTWSEDFSNAAWVTAQAGKSSTTEVVAAIANAPLWRITEDTATNRHEIRQNIPAATIGQNYVLTVYAKQPASNSRRYLQVFSSFTNDFANFDLQSGTVTAGVGSITFVGSGVYRLQVPMLAASAGTIVYFALANSGTLARAGTYAGDGVSSLLLTGAQLETGSTATAYQRVVSQYDVTEAGVSSLSYLAFDGVDDFLVTPTITPGIDKVQAFAGTRKLSDAAIGMLAEISVNFSLNAGAFAFTAPDASGGTRPYAFNSRGSAAATTGQRSVASGLSPDTAVLTGLGDIPADSVIIRRNGVASAAGTDDQGTGNYLAYPMYIGRRAGTALPFNGNLFSLIVRFGANLTADQITSTETWVNGKTRAY